MTMPKRAEAAGAIKAQRPMVTAGFAVSWDGRVIERRSPEKRVDAVLFGSEAEEWGESSGVARVLVSATGRIDAGASFFRDGTAPMIVYSTARMSRATQTALAAMRHVQVHSRADGEWPLREVLEHLRAMHGMRRVALGGGPELFRKLAADGLLDELCLAWRPRIVGGKSAPPITGLEEEFLPRGIALDLLKVERGEDEFVARYGVQASH
jgi:riboflavin biosynthesis pyrimidine reductase